MDQETGDQEGSLPSLGQPAGTEASRGPGTALLDVRPGSVPETEVSVRRPRQSRGQSRDRTGPSFLVPWTMPFAVLGIGGLLHRQLGMTTPAAPLTTTGLTALTVALTVLTWLYARPRGPVIRWHASTTTATAFFLLIVVTIFGLSVSTFWLCVLTLGGFALSWNIRRFAAVFGEGDEESSQKGTADQLGLSVKKVRVLEATPERAKAKWRLGDGQTLESVQSKLPALGSMLGTVRKGVRVSAGAREGDVEVTAIYQDVITGTLAWPGPTHPGGSIADGVKLGMYEDLEPCWIYPAGNYTKGIAPGHTGQSGMPRSGKGACAHIMCAELSTRRDVAKLILADTRKGRQFTDPIEHMIGWYWPTENHIRAGLNAMERAVVARNQALGDAGHSSWTPAAYDDPGLRMPALVLWLEEAAAYVDDFARLLVELAEACLSAGVFIVVSSQLWKHDRVPTSLRSNVANALVFGAAESADAGYLLSESTIAGGGDPGEWKTRYPGRFLMEGNGVDPGRFALNAKGFFDAGEGLREVTDEYGPKMARYDAVTLEAWGEAYVPYVPNEGAKKTPPASGGVGDETEDRPFPEEEAGMYGMPEIDDEDMAAQLATINPREAVPVSADVLAVDMMPETPAGARVWTREEKAEEFGRMLAAFADEGTWELKTSRLYDAWVERVGEHNALKPWQMHELIGARIDAGQLERSQQGRYRITTLVTHGE